MSLWLDDDVARDRFESPPPDSRQRWILLGVLLALPVAAVLAIWALLPGGGDDDPDGAAAPTTSAAPTKSPSPSAEPSTTSSTSTSSAALDVVQLSAGEARTLLEQAGERVDGVLVGSWSWTDANGRNLLTTSAEGGDRRTTLRVIHVAALDDQARVLRTMRDPMSCRRGPVTAQFAAGSIKVGDLDGDGVAEVSVGWSASCEARQGGPRGDRPGEREREGEQGAEQTIAKLAVITDGQKYILRGEPGAGGSPQPDPGEGEWPAEYYQAATELYATLFG